MPQVKFDRIVSCSSEDPAHPAKNLLLDRNYNRKWKCKEPGEQKVSVIIQLNQPYLITGIDIGNESSSFVEVLVSRTSTPDDFQVLLVMSSFMTPMDARNETNRNRVRMFTQDNLSDEVRKEKWDRIKVVCTQPFNKHLQYGLSFIVLHSSDSKPDSPLKPNSSVKKALGRFALKDDDEDDNNISVGSFFSRRKDIQSSPAPVTGAAAIRDASSPANLAEHKAVKKRKGSDDLTDSQKKKRGRPKNDVELTMDNSPSTSSSAAKPEQNRRRDDKKDIKNQEKHYDSTGVKPSRKKDKSDESSTEAKPSVDLKKLKESKKNRRSSADDDFGQVNATQTGSHSNRNQPSSSKGNVTYRPFNKLFEGVEIVISGYQNPGRSHVRDKALQMGAKYNANWGPSSTHLICAFPNTPKFQEVQGNGIIVIRDWVDDCFQERKKLSWRKYTTVVEDRKNANSISEPEVWELIPGMDMNCNSPLPPASRRNNIATKDTRLESDSEDSEDEIERIKAKQILRNKKNEKKTSSTETDEIVDEKLMKNATSSSKTDAYNDSTDVDSEEEARMRMTEWSEKKKKSVRDNLPPLPEFFNGKIFFLSPDLPMADKNSVARYITAFGGEILQSQDSSVNYIISRNICDVSEAARSVCVTPEWVWDCNDRQRLISPSSYKPEEML